MSLITINALFNIIGANSLILGYFYLKRHGQSSEQWCMNLSFLAFILFLTSLLLCIYEINIQLSPYFTLPYAFLAAVLTIHIILAFLLPVLIVFAIWVVLTGRSKKYRKKLIVYWIFSAWILVSLTGVFLYNFSEKI